MDDMDWETLYQACEKIRTYVAAQSGTHDLDPCECSVLELLENQGGKGMYPADISRLVGVQRPTLVPVLRALENRGLISHAPDPADGRRNYIVLSDRYYSLRAEEQRRRAKRFGELFVSIPAEDASRMLRSFTLASAGLCGKK